MAEEEEFDAVLEEQGALNQETIAANTAANVNYRCEYTKFVSWVKGRPDLDTNEAPFITRRNVDHCFTIVVARRAGNVNTTTRVGNALDWYAKHRESPRANPLFEYKSAHVTSAKLAQIAYNKTVGGTGKPGSDPHLSLIHI